MHNKRIRFERTSKNEECYLKPEIKSSQFNIDEVMKDNRVTSEF